MTKNRRKRKNFPASPPAVPKPLPTPATLFELGKFVDVVRFLLPRLPDCLTDMECRLLSDSFLHLGQHEEAAQVRQTIVEKNWSDYHTLAYAAWRQSDWATFVAMAAASLQCCEGGWTHYYMACALARGRSFRYHFSDAQEELARLLEHLKKAISFEDCPVEAVLMLDNLDNESDPDVRLARLAPFANINEHEIIKRLFWIYLRWKDDPLRAYLLVEPGGEQEHATTGYLWYAFLATSEAADYGGALYWLSRLENHTEPSGSPGFVLCKAQMLVKLDRFEEARVAFESLIAMSGEDQYIRLAAELGLAWEAWERGDTNLAREIALAAIDRWWPPLISPYSDHSWLIPVDIPIDEHYFYIDPIVPTYIAPLCRWLLSLPLTSAERGQVAYVLYTSSERDGSLDEFLIQAYNDAPTGAMEFDMFHVFERRQDYVCATYHFLREILYLYSQVVGPDQKMSWEIPSPLSKGYWGFIDRVRYEGEANEALINRLLSLYDCRSLHRLFMKVAHETKDVQACMDVLLPFYHSFWRVLLWCYELFDELFEASSWVLEQDSECMLALFDRAAVLERRGDVVSALTVVNRIVPFPAAKQQWTRWREALKAKIEQDREAERRVDFLRTAPDRWREVDYFKKRILATLSAIKGFDGRDWDHLGRLSGVKANSLPTHWRKLAEMGMVVQVENDLWVVNEYIMALARRERTHELEARLIRGDSSLAYKPVFNSTLEYTIYQILKELFPNYLVFPNMALSSIFDYGNMKERMDNDAFRYFLMATVDCCIVDTDTYQPRLAVELDSNYHDGPEQQARDTRKDAIFQLGGLDLIRVRPFGNPSREALRNQMIERLQTILPKSRVAELLRGIRDIEQRPEEIP